MLHIKSLEEGLEIFKALGSNIRVEIIKLLRENPGINMNDLASLLNVTNGALTSHIKKLEDCGLISVTSESAGHGNQKICSVNLSKILIDIEDTSKENNVYETELKIGHYSDYNVFPTCGLSSADSIIGEVDDARYFAHPSRYDADILWFTKGFVEYIIPNFIPAAQKIDKLVISAELSSEAPGTNDTWPSDISFYINDICIGCWTSPGDFGDVKGVLTPDWWYRYWNQYGLLKVLVINDRGTFIDGIQISNVTILDLQLTDRTPIRFKLAVNEDSPHVGGLTIFGKHFGNYNQDIQVRINYSPVYPE